MATQTQLAKKVDDINRLINHRFTAEELSEKLRRQGALNYKKNVRRRFDLEREVAIAKANGDTEEAEKLQKELNNLLNPALSWGTSIVKPTDNKLTEAERVHKINIRNQKLDHENIRKAQIAERNAARKAAAAVARGEAVADPFMRVRTVAKTHHDVSQKPKANAIKPEDADSTKTDSQPAIQAPKVLSNPDFTPKKKSGMISYRNNDDENIAALDLDIDIEI